MSGAYSITHLFKKHFHLALNIENLNAITGKDMYEDFAQAKLDNFKLLGWSNIRFPINMPSSKTKIFEVSYFTAIDYLSKLGGLHVTLVGLFSIAFGWHFRKQFASKLGLTDQMRLRFEV